MLLPVVVTELEGGVAEVPQHVAVVDVLPDGEGEVQRVDRRGPPPSATWVIATSMCPRHRVRDESSPAVAVSRSSDRSGVPLSAPNVRITAAATPISRARTGSASKHRVRGLDEDPVRLRRPSRC